MSDLKPSVQSLRRVRFNSIWLVPIVALVVAGWMLYQNWATQGPLIEIVASNAEGLSVGKTKVKARNVDVGEVTSIHLSKDYNHAIIQVRLDNGTRQMLGDDTKFWVIKPRIGREGISGLGTLLSGAYIEMEPGHQGEKTRFNMLTQAPLSTSEDQGIRLRLRSNGLSKLDVGAPVHFHGYEVGYIEKVGFDLKSADITYRLFIKAPYDELVNSSVQFWLTPGLAIVSSARGVQVKMDSLETLLSGGISFGVTKGHAGKPVPDFTQFNLYGSKEQAENHRYDQFINYVFLFNSNISGLEEGAPVEFRGIRIGTVTQVPYNGISFHRLSTMSNPSIPVLARIEPQRLDSDFQKNISLKDWQELLKSQIKLGLRASLETSNILTGAKIIDIDFVPHAKAPTSETFGGYAAFPTVAGKFNQIQNKLVQILDHLAKAPIQQTMQGVQQTLKQADQSLISLRQSSDQLNQLLKRSTKEQLPTHVRDTLVQINRTLSQYQQQGAMGQSLQQSFKSLQRSLNELQPLLQQLGEHSNALIFDHSRPADKIPPAGHPMESH
ncbi:intermembrane transport protein PqiB [Celerinatantimonas yamalensis]|uniref:Intermembrane transport protein PqiB n=1 Tax=Celerinatantimonas yamalensis TaxID=559956 RepID=A0ABW9G4Q5_9GAMM